MEGCHLCTLIWHCFLWTDIVGPEEAIKDHRETSLAFLPKITKLKHSLHWYKFSEPDIGLILSTARSLPKDVKPRGPFIDLTGPPFSRHIRLETCSSLRSPPRLNVETTPSPELHSLHPIPISSEQFLDLAATWIYECKSSHESCQEMTINTRRLPTRLIYLSSTGGHCNPRLVATAHTVISSQYLTLYYCWGEYNTTTLTKENLTSFHQEIQLDSLPKTIQDAIYVAQQLGFGFLWVDSLCIVQDDPDDWAREAASMADVYSNCLLIIAALGGSSSSTGLCHCTVKHGG